MNKLVKKIINTIIDFLLLFTKDKVKISTFYTFFSKILYDNYNNIEFDKNLNVFWLKHKDHYLFAVKKPYFNYSKKNLFMSIEEIYCKHYKPNKNDLIIDIGAGIGTELLYFHEKIGQEGKIYSIEASPDSYIKLEALAKKNNILNSFNYNIAISNSNGIIWIEETDHFEVNQVNKNKKGIEIKSLKLDEFVKINKINKINLLKVNIEGAELDMIGGMKESIKLIENIAVSCHDFLFKENKKIKESLVGFFQENDFEIYYNNTGNTVTDSWIYAKKK
jgi:FkbM family methyltransferase